MLIAFFCAGLATWALLFDVQAVLPAIAEDFQVGAATAALAVSATTLGLAIAVLPWSAVSDRLGRAPAMQVSILATAVVSAVSVFAPDLGVFLVVRFVLGLCLAGLPAVSMAYLAEEIAPGFLPQTAGIFVAGNTIGGMVGRMTAGPLSELVGWRVAVGVVSAIGIMAALLFVVLIPRSRADADSRPRTDLRDFVAKVVVNLRDPRIRVLYALGAIVLGTFTAVYNYLAFRLTDALHVPPAIASVLFLGLSMGTLGSIVAGRLALPWGRQRTVLIGLAVAGIGIGLLAIPAVVCAFLGLAVTTFGVFMVNAVVYGWVGQHASIGKAQATAMFQLFTQTGNALVGWGAGIVFGAFGWLVMMGSLIALLVIGAVVAFVGLPRTSRQMEVGRVLAGPRGQ
ncbi:MAG: MFS transporter [Microbacterium sp.]